ncbi:serine/threonine protein kinase [Pseudonocardia sp. ICBG601]|uniref:serine/threonine-protein kinase n=1 Tax=Pseudonocardia sp. ICBG601 TaxID=2846759 RepID=UPI0027E3AB30|nr:serine/threonine protein kinase [Pseudonocardia sp. ICBG601]
MSTPAAARCPDPECPGTLDDGWCDTCGLEADEAPAATQAATRDSTQASTQAQPATGAMSERMSGPATGAMSGPMTGAMSGPMTGAMSGPTGSGSFGTGSGASRASRRGSGRTGSSSSRTRLGAGLVDVPPVPTVDPASAVLADPQVAESKRFCSKCGQPVGRGRDGRPGRTEGFCPNDGAPYSFSPKLVPGTLVGGQYEVQGCLAHGGLGWIYSAIDRQLGRWCVLKGLLDSGDADAMAAAAAEKRFLSQVSHANIVEIYNFTEHPGEDGKPVGYIVMEYLGGSSLKQLLEARRRPDGTFEPLPVPQAIAYVLEMLPALGYLHSLGLVYCDFKPDNVIQFDRRVKLIDLGAVIRADDTRSAVFGTHGYQAPEIAKEGPSAASDVFTVGRTLAVMALGIVPARKGQLTPLPDDHPVLRAHESFHRLLRRATDPDPLRRFVSADEMTEQLSGVLREVLATDEKPCPGCPRCSAPRTRRSRRACCSTARARAAVPTRRWSRPRCRCRSWRPTTPAASVLATASVDRAEVRRIVDATEDPSAELRLRLVRAHLDARDVPAARALLAELAVEDPDDWRLEWYGGVAALAEGDVEAACVAFDNRLLHAAR